MTKKIGRFILDALAIITVLTVGFGVIFALVWFGWVDF